MDKELRAHYEALVLRNCLNQLTDEEQAELAAALDKYPEVRRIDSRLQQSVKAEYLPPIPAVDAAPAEYGEFGSKTHSIRNMRWAGWLAAACLLGAIAAAAYLLIRPETEVSLLAEAPGVQLRLANGQTVGLNGDTVLQAGNAKLTLAASHLQVTGQEAGEGKMNEIVVPARYDYKLTLSDGSFVQLNSKTSIKFPFSFGATREVYIDGEAFFEVVPDAKKPFMVHFPGGKLQVLGTSFNISSYGWQTAVASLVSGSAKVVADDRSVVLTPGIAATVNRGDLHTQPFDTTSALAWRSGIVYFDNESLRAIAQVIERWYDVSVTLEGEAQNVKLTTRISKGQPLEEFFFMLERTAQLKVSFNDKQIRIYN